MIAPLRPRDSLRDEDAELMEQVRQGRITAQVAQRILVPVARQDREACCKMAETVVRENLSRPEIQKLYETWLASEDPERAALLADPRLYLRALEQVQPRVPVSPAEQLLRTAEQLSAQTLRLSVAKFALVFAERLEPLLLCRTQFASSRRDSKVRI